MRKIIWLLILVNFKFLKSQDIPAQNASSLVSNMATPNVANMERFGESPVNYYNGKSSLTVPIYTIKAGNITYPISLNYAAGGIQVNSLASDVGLGWSITDTFVNRTIVGDADWETLSNPYKTNENCNTNENFGYTNFKWGYFYKKIVGPTFYFTTAVDYFPDIFKFNSPQDQTRFTFPNRDVVRDLDQKNTQIQWNVITKTYNYLTDSYYGNAPVNSQQCITDYDNFTITTKDGLKYYFQDKDIYHSYAASGNVYDALGSIAGTFPRVGSWHVSKIMDNVTGQEINFVYEEYTTESSNDIGTLLSTHHYFDCSGTKPSLSSNIQTSCWLPQGSDAPGSFYYNRGLNIKRLKKIIFPTGSVEFNYNQNRNDLHNGKALTGIIIKDYNNLIINEFELKYDYFYSTIQKNEYSKRLKLLSVQELGRPDPQSIKKPKYEFEYYEDIQMPNIGSAFQDFFGYCNQVEVNQPANVATTSKYYYYPGKREFSLLPYNISTDNNHYLLKGNIDKEPNELSRTWSLKKVTFPTGGSNYYDLESNTFSLWGSNLKGAGVRVKTQILQESANSPSRTISYYYTNGNSSSGYLFNVPYVGHPATFLYDPYVGGTPNLSGLDLNNLEKYFFLYNSSRINFDILNNFFIGYSKVEENENGKKSIYEYYNEEYPNIQTRSNWTEQGVTNFTGHCMSGFLVTNSALGNEAYIDRSRLRGKLQYMSNYNASGDMIRQQENVYSSFTEDDYNPDLVDELYVSGANVILRTGDGGSNSHYAEIMSTKKSYNLLYNNLSYAKTTNFLTNGNIIEEKNYDYDTSNQNVLNTFIKIKNGSSYPYYEGLNYVYPNQLWEPYSQELVNINKLDIPMVIRKSKGELDLIGQTQTDFSVKNQTKVIFSKDTNTSNKVLPIQTQLSGDGNSFYEVGTYDRYDNKGNLLQSTKDGISTTYIYGYNQNYPIATIVGATYEQVFNALGNTSPDNSSYLSLSIVTKSNLDNDEQNEKELIQALDTFRSTLSNYQITTYTYDPLVGLTSVTPPNGFRQIYSYDSYNRLKTVKDINGRILKEYKYNYKQ